MMRTTIPMGNIDQLIALEQSYELISAEIESIDQHTKMASKEIIDVITYISKN